MSLVTGSSPKTDVAKSPETPAPRDRLRFVTAASLFDGHDASINIMRRILQAQGAEVIHLGHDRSVADIVKAAVEEDAHAVAVSSYQGGHMEYFTYMVDLLREMGRPEIKVFAGAAAPSPTRRSRSSNPRCRKVYSVEDGRSMGLVGMIRDMMTRSERRIAAGSRNGRPGCSSDRPRMWRAPSR
jgi:methylmalonyl-CoA mutase